MRQKHISRRGFLQITGVGMAAGLLAACAPSGAPAGQAGSSEAGAQPAADGSNELVLWGLQYDPHVDRYNALAEAFEAKTGTKIVVQPQAWPLETKLLAAITADTQPDVVCVMGRVSIPLFSSGAVLEMDDVVYKDAGVDPQEFFFTEALEAYTWNGKVMGVPLESNQIGASVGARHDDLEEIGEAATSLWPSLNGKEGFDSYEEMWELAEVLKKTEGDTVTRWGISSQGWDLNQFQSIMYSLGEFFWNEDQKVFTFDSEAAVQAMQIYIETPVQRGLEAQLDDHHMNSLFAGKVGIGVGNTSMPGEGEKLGLRLEAVNRPPAIQGEKALYVGEGGWGFEIPTRAKNMDNALEFAKWMVTREGQVIFAQIYGGVVPATAVVLDDPIYEGDDLVKVSKRRAIASLEDTVFRGHGWGGNVTGHEVPFTECRQGVITAAQACANLQELMTINYEQWTESMSS